MTYNQRMLEAFESELNARYDYMREAFGGDVMADDYDYDMTPEEELEDWIYAVAWNAADSHRRISARCSDGIPF